MSATLPIPEPAAKSLSNQLYSNIVAEIQQSGPMPFARYMDLALYAPKLGYYRNALHKFGSQGDFVTAPDISEFFSRCVAAQCAQVLSDLKGGDILEFGAGQGTMAADILIALDKQNHLPNQYYILELSAQLKAVQRETIKNKAPNLLERVVWLNELPSEPLQGVFIGNEVLDAMPVHQFHYQDGFVECAVGVKNDVLVSCPATENNSALIEQLQTYDLSFENGYTSEVNLYLPGWMKSVSAALSKGLLLLMDYGFPRCEYYHPQRHQGTLMCHYQHHAHSNPLVYPGIQDITAHVDFTAVAESAHANDFGVGGFTNQAGFLMNCGLLSFVDNTADEKTRFMQKQQVLKLTSPNEMGDLFKAIGLTKNYDEALIGFREMDHLARL